MSPTRPPRGLRRRTPPRCTVPSGLLPVVVLLASCKEPDPDPDPGSEPEPRPELVVQASIEANPDNPFSAFVALEADRDVDASIELSIDGTPQRSTPTWSLGAGVPAEWLVLGMYADTTYELSLVATEGDWEWQISLGEHTTDPVGEAWSGCTASSDTPLEDFDPDQAFCLHGPPSFDQIGVYCFDRLGEPVWSLVEPGETLFLMRPLADGGFAATAETSDRVFVYDRSGAQVDAISSLDLDSLGGFEHELLNAHGLVELREGPWAGALGLLTASTEQMEDGRQRVGSGIVVLDRASGEVLWDWHVLGELGDGMPVEADLLELPGCGHDDNCLHANDLVHGVDGDGAQFFLLNLMGASTVLRIDVDSGAIAWRLGEGGDFTLVDDLDAASPAELVNEEWMFHTHGWELQQVDGDRMRLLLFDNHTGHGQAGQESSRVLAVELDQAAMLVAPVFVYDGREGSGSGSFYATMCGDADMLPAGDSFVFIKGDQDVFVAEVGYPDADERWRLSCPEYQGAYQVQYFPSLYETSWWYDAAQ